jgi:hypothetical protein
MSGFEEDDNAAPIQGFSDAGYGQSYPEHYPGVREPKNGPLGPPLTIREVARLIGCSDWTVRHRYLGQGLPHLRSGPSGKLIFYRDQVIAWILAHQRQQKGGKTL